MSSDRLILPGYTVVETLRAGQTRMVYRAVGDVDAVSVIVKTAAGRASVAEVRASLEREAGVLEGLPVPGVPGIVALETRGSRPALVLEDLGGDPLAEVGRARALGLAAKLEIAREIAETLGNIHSHGFVHRDINPSNILIDTATLDVSIIDFGLATPLVVDDEGTSPDELEGTPAYVSPEQTGRTGWPIDHRSDLYSLGATLYDLFTGRLPFESDDPLKIVHAHIALQPTPPHEVAPEVPTAVGKLILKLLAKSPEERYQSAAGLAADLARCLDEYRAMGHIRPFEPGSQDLAERLAMPRRLYGRDGELAALRAALGRAREDGEILLVAGYSGIGKTSLVMELRGTVGARGGRFVSGKFDQLVRGTPYTAIREAFVELARQLLTEPDEEVARRRAEWLDALGASGQVVLDLLPEFEPILGPQPPVPELGPAEAQNRFNRVFRRFLRALAAPDRPLVLFLDDLQWIDTASLDLLRILLTGRTAPGLLVVAAYRDNEVGPTHPLTSVLAELEASGTTLSRIALEPLDGAALERFVADTLRGSREHGAPLAELVGAKTGGNPFFLTQFMKSLAQEHLLRPDHTVGVWAYDLDGIRGQPSTDNVVELLAGRIERLPGSSRDVLETAACLGNRFDETTLATAWGGGLDDVRSSLLEALREGLILSIDERATSDGAAAAPSRAYRFLHDRVQQAAYARIPERERAARHLAIGRRLLVALDEADREERAFELVDQIRPGLELLADPEERRVVMELARVAGDKARTAAAYAEALDYFRTAADLLPDAAWSEDYETAFGVHLCIAECEYLSGRFDDGFRSLAALSECAATPLDGARVQIVRAAQYETMSRYEEAVDALRQGLAPLGIDLPTPDGFDEALERELDAADEALGDREVASLVELPIMDDPLTKMCMRLLAVGWAPSYLRADSRMISWIPARMVRLSLEHGNTEESAFGYVAHGFTLGTRRGEYRRGQSFGRVALELNDALDDLRFRGKVHELFGCFVDPWCTPLVDCIESQRTAFRAGIEGGDFAYGSYGGFVGTWYVFLTRQTLDGMEEEFAPTLDFLRTIKNESFTAAERLLLNWALALRGRTAAPESLDGEGFTEEAFLAGFGQAPFFRVFYDIIKLHLHVTSGRWAEARSAAAAAERVVHSVGGTIWPMLLCFYRALAQVADRPFGEIPDAPPGVAEDLGRLATWAGTCPQNFAHAELLIRAELARVRGDDVEAQARYAAAIDAATVRAFPGDLALANERYGRYWLERSQDRIGSLFLLEALRTYEAWGAQPKAETLAEELSRLIGGTDGAGTDASLASPAAVLATLQSPAGALDFEWAMQAAGAIASEIELDRLLSTLMGTLLASAGAERGCLILEREDEPIIRVSGDATTDETSLEERPATDGEALPQTILRSVRRARTTVLVEDASEDPAYVGDPYVRTRRPRSVLCLPVLYQGELVGSVYLENNLNPGAFTRGHLHLLETLSTHAAIAIRNAELFDEVARLEERVRAENVYLQETIRTHHEFEEIVGESDSLMEVLEQVEQVAPTDATVLIQGETGTGKELLARAIHRLSPRSERPLIAVNCGAISPGLIESELFGHEKGAFTGATARKIGRFELADGGTILLDEIGDLALDLQVKLLRVLQEGEIERVGGRRTIPVDVRVIAGTHQDLERAAEEGRFRPDLYYRLNVFPIRNPPLRERTEDIPLLVRYFVMKDGNRLGKRIETIPRRTMDAFLAYPWPGNVRELRNVIERSIITSRGSSLELGNWLPDRSSHDGDEEGLRTLDEVQRDHIERALQQTGWVVSGPRGAARRLGLKPTTLEARMKKLGIRRPR